MIRLVLRCLLVVFTLLTLSSQIYTALVTCLRVPRKSTYLYITEGGLTSKFRSLACTSTYSDCAPHIIHSITNETCPCLTPASTLAVYGCIQSTCEDIDRDVAMALSWSY